jgi:hypothetical protein
MWATGTYTITVDVNDNAGNTTQDSVDVNMLKNYHFNILDQSKTLASGTTSFVLDGNFRDDLGIVPTGIDVNTILITSSVVIDSNVIFDENGFYQITTNSLTDGTYYIDLNYNTTDYNYTHRITVAVSVPSSGSGSGSGGGGGGSSTVKTTEEPEDEVVETPVEETPTEEPTTPETPTEPTGEPTGETGTGDNGSPATGFFGLGDLSPEMLFGGLAAILIILIIGGAVYFKKIKV